MMMMMMTVRILQRRIGWHCEQSLGQWHAVKPWKMPQEKRVEQHRLQYNPQTMTM